MSRHKTAALAILGSIFVTALGVPACAALSAKLDIDVDKPGAAIPASFYGLMTEEINHSYDGGLFAELVQNRTFQDPPPRQAARGDQPAHWSLVDEGSGARMSIDRGDPVNAALPISLRLDLTGGRAGAASDGFWGIPVRPDTTYTASFYAKAGNDYRGPVTASIITDEQNATVATATTTPLSNQWQKYILTLKTDHHAPTTAKARFVLGAAGRGSVWFSMVSLFPPTYMDTPGGLRPDLMRLMADLHPAFIRLPGGNYLEGDTFPTRFNWKQMIGPADQRPGHMGCWSYRSSDGFGLPQYLLWCKQLGAEPVLAVFAGYTLNHDHVNAGSPEMAQYTQEALEEIEYVSGPADSEWGKRRAADGFPEPFTLHYVEIGNEDWFDRSHSYDGRFTQMAEAIRAKYPKLKLIATAPVKSSKPDLYDDHYYRSARQMAFDWDHYDPSPSQRSLKYGSGHWSGADRGSGTQTFVGEWATEEGQPTPDLNAALADAAWLMGLERNADAVPIECYAPLLVNVNPGAWQWGTNLIGYDAMSAFGSPSYYAQAMFGQNKGDVVLPATLTIASTAPVKPAPHGGIGVGSWHTQCAFKDIVVTHGDNTLYRANLATDATGWQPIGGKWQLQNDAIAPLSPNTASWVTTGDPAWTDYTLSVKARKTGGAEGFLILFRVVDGDNYDWWNVGGWGNTHSQLEATQEGSHILFGSESPFTVETGRWYDLRVEVTGRHVRCFADNQLITEADEPVEKTGTPVFASASYMTSTHELIVKVVNLGNDPVEATVNLHGTGQVSSTGKAIVLSGSPRDVNTIEQPTRVTPKQMPLSGMAATFSHEFPPYSLTLLRLTAAPQP
jgi:alpha-L-arabinofuranosidase